MSGYTPAEKIVYTEALRTVPGLVAAKERKAADDASRLFEGYMVVARENGLNATQSWSIMFNASIHWVHQLAQARAASSTDERTTLDVAFSMGAVASTWSA